MTPACACCTGRRGADHGSGRSPGSVASRSQPDVAGRVRKGRPMVAAVAAPSGPRSRRPTDRCPARRDEVVEQPRRTRARRRRTGPPGRRATGARRAPRRPQTRRRGSQNVISDPGDQERERRPDDPLARVLLRDQQRVLAERRELHGEVGPVGRRRTRRVASASGSRPTTFGRAVGVRARPRGTGARAGRPSRRRRCWSSSCRPTSRPGTANSVNGKPAAESVIGTGPSTAACRSRRGSRRPARARSRSGGTCSRRPSAGR